MPSRGAGAQQKERSEKAGKVMDLSSYSLSMQFTLKRDEGQRRTERGGLIGWAGEGGYKEPASHAKTLTRAANRSTLSRMKITSQTRPGGVPTLGLKKISEIKGSK